MIGYEKGREAYIKWRHIDGPLLVCGDGTIRWLSLKEILLLGFRLTTAEKIARSLRRRK